MNNYIWGLREQCSDLKQLEDMMLSLPEKTVLGAGLDLGLFVLHLVSTS